MQYKVPQDVQREDQILWFITLRQLILLMVGCGISYLLFVNMKKAYNLNGFEIALIWLPGAISAAFAFLKIKGISLSKFFLLILEQVFFRSSRRYWIAGTGEPFVSMTMTFKSQNSSKSTSKEKEKMFDQKKAEKLAQFLDQEKYHSPNNNAEKNT
jgi:hypothetical protein